MRSRELGILFLIGATVCSATAVDAQARRRAQPAARTTRPAPTAARLDALKRELVQDVEARSTFTQQMVDQIFSFGELGFQEVETSKYVIDILRKNGFTVQEGIAGIPTAWLATWGNGRPVIALGSDIDGIPQASQMPGVACHAPIVPGAPGHGEGHNSGVPLNVTAALAVKKVMERDKIPGTLTLWPGVAEELLATKAYLVRAGVFNDVDAVIFSHVASNLGTSWGDAFGSGLVSVMFSFEGVAAHSAGAPWRGRSALDAVELMNTGWNFRREHLPLQQRSHYVIRDGGDQPNVVPTTASVWYYFREIDYPGIKRMWAIGDSVAQGAAKMTGTTLLPTRVLGSAWPRHFNRPIAQALTENAKAVGLPRWTDADQTLARAVQREVGAPDSGLATRLDTLAGPITRERNIGGGSDDIGDVSWTVPTVTLGYPSNVPNLPGHHWSSSIAMATPIAHKGATAGAKVAAMTVLDLLLKPALVDSAWAYFRNVQTKTVKYEPLIRPNDKPAIEWNAGILERYRPEMRKYYFDAARHKTYLEQLGIAYPVVKGSDGKCQLGAKVVP